MAIEQVNVLLSELQLEHGPNGLQPRTWQNDGSTSTTTSTSSSTSARDADGLTCKNSKGRIVAVAGAAGVDAFPTRWLVLVAFDLSYSTKISLGLELDLRMRFD